MSLLAIGGAAAVGTVALGRWNHRRIMRNQRQQYRYFRLLPHASTSINDETISRMMEQFAGFNRPQSERISKGREWFRLLIHKDSIGKIAFYIGYPEDRTTGVHRTLCKVYPDSEIHPITHDSLPLPDSKTEGYSGKFRLSRNGDMKGLPLKPFDAKNDALVDILHYMEAGSKGTHVWLDLVFSPTSYAHLKKSVEKTMRALRVPGGSASESFGQQMMSELKSKPGTTKKTTRTESVDLETEARIKAVKQRFSGRETAFDVSLSVYVTGKHKGSIAQSLATSVSSVMQYDNALRFIRTKHSKTPDVFPVPDQSDRMLWTGDELANLFHLPSGENRIYENIPHLAPGQRSLKPGELEDGVAIGKLNHPVQQGRAVCIPREQFTKHGVLTGMTGSGKSSTAVEAVQSLLDDWLQDPVGAPGFSYFDPAGETVATILSRLLKAEMDGKKVDWSRVHYVYLGPTEHPIGLNLLYNGSGEETDEIVTDVMDLLHSSYGGDTPQMDRLVRNALMTLVEDSGDHTMLGIVPLFTDERFRNRIVPRVTDPMVAQFWKYEFAALESKLGQAVGPILNRLSPIINNKTMRRMFGQKNWSLNLKKWMDDGHIILWDLLNVKKRNIKLTVGHLCNQYHYTYKTRNTGAKEHIMLIDEAHDVQVPVLPKIIAEDRKFGACLFLITQFVGQFEDWLIESVSENVGTILTCAQGSKSAAIINRWTAGSFKAEYLQKLPERTVAVYTRTKDETGRSTPTTFTIQSDPPFIYRQDGQIANHRNESEVAAAKHWALSKGRELQERDGMPKEQVDQEIAEYLYTGTALEDFEEDELPLWS